MKRIAIPLFIVLLMTGCSSQALLGAKCSFARTNDPNAPRSYECSQLERQQEQEARNRRLDSEKKRREKAQQEAQQEQQKRIDAYATESAEQMAGLRQSLASMPDPAKYYEQGDLNSARVAAVDITTRIRETRAWFESQSIPHPEELSSLCASARISLDWYRLLDRKFSNVAIVSLPYTSKWSDAHRSGDGCYDRSVLHEAIALQGHANMFKEELPDAEYTYFELRGGPPGGPEYYFWEDLVKRDFHKLREAGLDHPYMDEVLSRFASSD